jgi:ATP-dependent DNA ligase
MARRDAAGVRLLTRNGHDWASRFPLIVEAMAALRVRSCLIDGEAVCCDDNGMAVFAKLRQRRNDRHVVLYAFDLLELDGQDLRREPLERRKVLLARLLVRARIGLPACRAEFPPEKKSAQASSLRATKVQSSQANGGLYASEAGRVHPVIVGWSTRNRPLLPRPINDTS